MQTQSKLPYFLLYVLLLYSLRIFEIDTEVLLENASNESTEHVYTEGFSAGRINQIFIPVFFAITALLFLSDGSARKLMIKKPASLLFIIATGILMMASVSVSAHTNLTIVRSGSQLMFLSGLTFLAYALHDQQRLLLTIGLAFLTALIVDMGLFFGLGTGFTDEGRFVGYLGNKNTSGNQYAITAILFVFLTIQRKNPLFLIAGLVSVALLLMSESKTSIGAIGIFLVLALFYRIPIARGVIIVSTLIGILALSIVFSLGENNPEIFTNRGELWNFLSLYVWDKPLLGHGFASFWAVGPQSINEVEGVGFVQQIDTGHNGFIDMLLGTGIAGLIVAVGFLFFSGLHLARLDYRYFYVHYLYIAFLVANLTESYLFYYQNIMWTVLVLLICSTNAHYRLESNRRSRRRKKRRIS